MAQFLTTHGISFQVENIIKQSQNKLYLISPYLKLTNNFQDRMKDVEKRGVSIVLVYGKERLSNEIKKQLCSINNLEVFFLQDLHAKCYANEDTMVITSMNMHEYSEKKNREMGVFIDKKVDKEMYDDAFQEIESILRSATKEDLGKKTTKQQNNANQSNRGYCIRCGSSIKFHPEYTLCSECFAIWSCWGNTTWPEKFCHCCGNEATTSKEKPLCYTCFSDNKSIFH